jgi:hypothetical protein
MVPNSYPIEITTKKSRMDRGSVKDVITDPANFVRFADGALA